LVAIALFLVGLQFIVFALLADMVKGSRKINEDIIYRMKLTTWKKGRTL
jgi:hypothetical protein